MRVVVTGATGLIGGRLCSDLMAGGHTLVVLARNPESARSALPGVEAHAWDATSAPAPTEALDGADAVVHLAGESIAAGRWTTARKKLIRDSRVVGTRNLVAGLAQCRRKPATLVNGSATGFYGNRGDELLDEASDRGSGFLADVCVDWENEARKAEGLGVRVVLLRTGFVLAAKGGALPKMLMPFRFFVGGPVASGRQYISWIHIDDEVGLIRHALERTTVSGPLNATAPHPRTNEELGGVAARLLKRPALFRVPAFVLRLALGEMAELLLEGQRVLPRKAEQTGYRFRFAELEPALESLLR